MEENVKTNILFAIILLVIVISCSQSPNESGSYSVDGTIFYDGEPVGQALVRLTNSRRYNMTVTTDDSGSFNFQNVPEGAYDLTSTKTFENGCFIEKSDEIYVENDCSFSNLILPDPVIMYEATNITNESLKISWSPSIAPDFREYKLYRGLTSGLDETTGLLVHVSTTFSDTIFTNDELNAFEIYYYRVYVMNDYGRMGGSNIISATTMNIDIVKNGSFEELSGGEPTLWELIPNSGNPANYIIIDSTDASDGINSLKFHHEPSGTGGFYEIWIEQYLDNSLLVAGADYLLTFSYKANFDRAEHMWLKLNNSVINFSLTMYIDFYNDDEWRQFEYEFALPDDIGNNDIRMCLHFENEGIVSWWIDAIQIVRLN